MAEESWRLMTLCLLTTVVALLLVLSIHLHHDVSYWQVSAATPVQRACPIDCVRRHGLIDAETPSDFRR